MSSCFQIIQINLYVEVVKVESNQGTQLIWPTIIYKTSCRLVVQDWRKKEEEKGCPKLRRQKFEAFFYFLIEFLVQMSSN